PKRQSRRFVELVIVLQRLRIDRFKSFRRRYGIDIYVSTGRTTAQFEYLVRSPVLKVRAAGDSTPLVISAYQAAMRLCCYACRHFASSARVASLAKHFT